MTRAAAALLAALALGGCYASTAPPGEADPLAEPLVDECVATGFASTDFTIDPDASPPPGHLVVAANYPIFSPDYVHDRYVDDLLVVIDDRLEARLGETEWGATGLSDVVFGRAAGDEAWRVLADPDAVCPPLPDGVDWPTGA